jgi:DNA-binding phage protein
MALTRDFKETVLARAQADPEFIKALLDEAVTLFLNGEADTAKLMLRDLVNATLGFEGLAQLVDKSPKSVHRMLSTAGNPTMSNLSTIFATLKSTLKVEIQTKTVSVS